MHNIVQVKNNQFMCDFLKVVKETKMYLNGFNPSIARDFEKTVASILQIINSVEELKVLNKHDREIEATNAEKL